MLGDPAPGVRTAALESLAAFFEHGELFHAAHTLCVLFSRKDDVRAVILEPEALLKVFIVRLGDPDDGVHNAALGTIVDFIAHGEPHIAVVQSVGPFLTRGHPGRTSKPGNIPPISVDAG